MDSVREWKRATDVACLLHAVQKEEQSSLSLTNIQNNKGIA